jgi:hypothetical protein
MSMNHIAALPAPSNSAGIWSMTTESPLKVLMPKRLSPAARFGVHEVFHHVAHHRRDV